MSKSRVVLLSILLSAGSGLALAQNAGPAPGGPTADHGRWNPAEMREHMAARHAEHAKALHDVLGIQSGQEAAFAAFVAATRRPEHDHDGDHGRGPEGGVADEGARMAMTTPERLDRMKAEMDRRFAAMRERFDRRAEATKTLYAALDPRQRAAMDALPELRGGHDGGDHGDRMGPRGPTGAGM